MLHFASLGPSARLAGLLVRAALLLAFSCAAAEAKGRHALLIGIGDYKAANGLNSLAAPANDVDELRIALEHRTIGFEVEVLKDADLPNKEAFKTAFGRFLDRIEPGDDVLIYFSGHGYFVAAKNEVPAAGEKSKRGNYYLLSDARSQPAYQLDLQKQKPLEARELDTQDKKTKKYEEWISEIALSEFAIEEAVSERKPEVLIFITDANRTLVSGSQDAAIVGGLAAPKSTRDGVFKLYSAARGQASLERPDEIALRRLKEKTKGEQRKDKGSGQKTAQRSGRKIMSLYTRVLIRELATPRLDIALLHSKVRYLVREEARRYDVLQVPAFSQDSLPTQFKFWEGDDTADIGPRCRNVKNELDNLRYGVIFGLVSRQDVELKRVELAPCGQDKVVEAYMRLQQQGAGETARSTGNFGSSGDPAQLCDELAASRFDKTRPEEIAGTEVQNTALRGLADSAEREKAIKAIGEAIAACETAVKERPRVSRYKYNLARANYALSVLTDGVTRGLALSQASKLAREAVDLGHAAAYHLLATLHLNGEIIDDAGKPQPPDRQKGWELLQRGAELSHVLALYDLGLAFKNGDLELDTDVLKEVKSDAKAYFYLSKAAESGFVPATIETALALRDGSGVPRDTSRAIEMLTLAASRGSPEAMFRLAEIYDNGGDIYEDHKVAADANEATLWFARAAEYGDTRAQEKLAENLTKGHGLPAQQPETAARYWRLAADGGSVNAQMHLANLLRDGKVPFRPKLVGKPDAGAEEIRDLYASAFARGNPIAGLELARLYRTGYPVGNGSEAIPKDPERAVALLWETMTRVRLMPEDSAAANPANEFYAAKELIGMYDAGEAVRADKTPILTEDQIGQLRADFGDPAKAFWILASSLGDIQCSRGPYFYEDIYNLWVLIWDSTRLDAPTETQFDWFEERNACRDRLDEQPVKGRERQRISGVSKKIREAINREYDAAIKDREKNPDTYKRFTDRMADLVAKRDKSKNN